VKVLSQKIGNLENNNLRNNSLPAEEVTKIAQKIKEKLKPYNSYTYLNTLLSNYENVIVYYGTGKNYNYKKVVSKEELKK
jgi:hypothetical protein